MSIETTKMSSRGQIVVPQEVREEVKAEEGTMFAIFGKGDTIILKKIEIPTKEQLINEFKNIAKEGKERAKKLGIKEKDIPNLVHKERLAK